MTPDLWYDAPASYWEGALPLGNGALGAMVLQPASRATAGAAGYRFSGPFESG